MTILVIIVKDELIWIIYINYEINSNLISNDLNNIFFNN
jgi:hypothetical protein